MSPEDSLFRLVYGSEYRRFGFDSTSNNYAWKAKNVYHLFTRFQKSIYNHQSFLITDGRIFGKDSSWNGVANFDQNNSWQRLSTLQPVTVCDINITCDPTCLRAFKSSSTNDVYWCGCPTVPNLCTTQWINVDPGAGSLPPVFYTTDIGSGGTADAQTWWVNPCPTGGGGGGPARMSVTEECSTSGWVPLPTAGGVLYRKLGYHHFETWDISGEDYGKIQYWRQNNIDTTGVDSCLRKVLDKLLGGNNLIGRILTKMDRSSLLPNNIEKFEITFRVDSLPTGVSGRTLPGHYNSTTRIFRDTIIIDDSLMMLGTELGVAHVVIHEVIHAYLKSIFHRYFYHNYTATQIGRMNYDTILNNYIDTLLSIHDRAGLNSWQSNNPEYEHNFMADKSLERMAEALKTLDNNRLSDEYYWILSWSGLWKTKTMTSHYSNYPAWPPTNPSPSEDSIRGLKYALTTARLDSIRKNVIDEIKGRPNAKGRPKIPGGCY
jgi:hypothetical protein